MQGLRLAEDKYLVEDYKFQSGETLPAVWLHYTTLGTLQQSVDADGVFKSNAVLILHGTGGSGSGFVTPEFAGVLFTPGGLLDASKYFIILPDGIGHGRSSKPSEGLRARFPQYTYDDMVQLQYLLLTQHLRVRHLRLVMGTSMGGMHTWIWGHMFPDFVDALMPLASLPVMIAGLNRMRRKIVLDALTREPGYAGGDYITQPPGLADALGILREMTAAPRALQREFPTREAADEHLAAYITRGLAAQDANDMIFAYASSREYNPEPHLERIIAPLVAVNSADDVVNPPDLGVMEANIGRVPRGRYVLIPTSDETRGHGTHSLAKIWEHELRRLLLDSTSRGSLISSAAGLFHIFG